MEKRIQTDLVLAMKAKNMALCGLFVALLTLCSWISIPFGSVPVTLQTLAVFLCLGLLGGKYGCITLGVYLLLGVVGVPVFSGFRGGAGVLMGATGGYVFGFLFAGLLYWVITHFHRSHAFQLLAIAHNSVCCIFHSFVGHIANYLLY